MWCDSGHANARWCSRGDDPCVEAMSCTVCLRNIHVAYSVPSSSSMVSDSPKPNDGVPLVERLHVVGDEVDVVEAVDAGAVAQVVALMVMTDPLDLVEVLDDEAERILARAPSARHRSVAPGRVAAHLAASIGVEHRGGIEIVRRAHTKREPRARRLGALAQDEAVVDELFVAAEVDRFVVFGTDDEAESIDPEVLAGAEVGDDQFGVRRANDVGRSGRGHRHDRTPRHRLSCGAADHRTGGPDASSNRRRVPEGPARPRSRSVARRRTRRRRHHASSARGRRACSLAAVFDRPARVPRRLPDAGPGDRRGRSTSAT